MFFYSTKDKSRKYSLKEAVLLGLPPDNGLFMPEQIKALPDDFFRKLPSLSMEEIGFYIASNLLGESIPQQVLKQICDEAFNFPAPLVKLDDNTFICELFHGPTLAFKDFGARFMSRVMAYLNTGEKKKLTILVATSGDTGGAVADGFYDVPGIEVIILYPSGGVSELQEKQLTTLGKNIEAIEVKGTFDDCQRLVKNAFLDKDLTVAYRLSSANSINITRLVPQSVYYFEAYKQLMNLGISVRDVVFVIPSGNFGNLTAGLLAKNLGLNISHFVAATNVNDIVPQYLKSGKFNPRASIATISNAMDVGNPSNFGRMLELFEGSHEGMTKMITGFAYTDDETRKAMKSVYDQSNYVADPHGAVGLAAWKDFRSEHKNAVGVILETAHPLKFVDAVQDVLGFTPPMPPALQQLISKQKISTVMDLNYESLKEYLFSRNK